jgi:hypothetical protein
MSHKQIENSLYTDSRNYDPLKSPDILRVRIADGARVVDRRDEFYGVTLIKLQATGNREFYELRRKGAA